MELKPGYKQTEVGVIPEDWRTCKLQEIMTSVSSGKSNTKSKTGKYPIYGSTGVIGFQNYFDYEGDKVLVARVGANAGTVNRVTGKYCVSDNTLMVSYQNNVDIRFACYQLINRNLNLLVFGSGQPLITGGQLKELVLPFPLKKAEQTAIANALSDADALIQSLTRLIAKKRQIKQGAMQTLLNPYESGRLKAGWMVKKLPDICWFQEGPGLRNWQFTMSGMKVINVTNLENGYLNLEKTDRYISYDEFHKMYRHFEIDENDIVMASSGNSYSKVAVVRKQDLPLVMNTSVIRFKPLKGLQYNYLLIFLKSHNFKNQIDLLITGGAQPNFGPAHLKKIKIVVPKDEKEQTRIATILSDMDAEIAALEAKLAKYRHIKQGMMQNLLTGKIRLI